MIWRISERRAFQDLVRSGRRARTQTLWCSYVNDPSAEPLRVAYSIGRAVGTATTRNLVRRRLRAIVATVAPRNEMDHGWLLIGARPASAERTFAELDAEVSSLLAQVASAAVGPSARRG